MRSEEDEQLRQEKLAEMQTLKERKAARLEQVRRSVPQIAQRRVDIGTEVVYGFRLCRISNLTYTDRGWLATVRIIKKAGYQDDIAELVLPLRELKRAR